MAKKKKDNVLDLPVAFGNVSIGDKTARIGITVPRSELSVSMADRNLCERRLVGHIVGKSNGDHPDQQQLEGMEDDDLLDGIFDVKGFSVSSEHISFGLTFAIKSVDVSSLAKFAKRSGKLIVDEVGELPDGEGSPDDNNGDE